MMRLKNVVSLVAAIGSMLACSSAAKAAPWVTAYYPSYAISTMPISSLNFNAITHLVFFDLWPTTTGGLTDPNGGVNANAAAVATAAHNANAKVLICIGGGGTEPTFAAALSSTSTTTTLVNNIVSWVATYGYDGVDIDDESLAAGDGPNYEAFITQLRAALPSGKLLTCACEPYGYTNVFAAVQSSFDQINVMTYDMANPRWTGYTWYDSNLYTSPTSFPNGNTPSSCSAAVQQYINAGIPASKLGLGVAFYGDVWNNGTSPITAEPTTDTITTDVAYSYIMSNYYSAGAYHYDNNADAPYLSLTSTNQFVSYDDPTLCAHKVDYVVNNGLGGMICWQIAEQYMPDHTQPLLTAMYNELVADHALPGAAPSAPTNLVAISGNGQINLTWSASTGATSYKVYRSTSSGTEASPPVATGVTGTSYVNSGLTPGTTYYFKVDAVNASGESNFSNEAWSIPSSGNIAPQGTGYVWYANTTSTANTNRVAVGGVIDGNLSTSNVINAAGEGGMVKYEGAGVVWPSTHSVTSVTFINGADDTHGNGFWQSGFGLQYTTNGSTWVAASGWTVSPAYPNSSSAWRQTYRFTGSTLTGVMGIRVVGATGGNSYSGSVIELQTSGS